MPNKGLQVLKNQGLCGFINAVARYIMSFHLPIYFYRAGHKAKYWKNPSTTTTADPFKIIYVNPNSIRRFVEPPRSYLTTNKVVYDSKGRFHKWENIGVVLGGEWDQNVSNEFLFEKAAKKRFDEGKQWEATEYYKQKLSVINNGDSWRGCQNEDDMKKEFDRWDTLYHSIKEKGYTFGGPQSTFRWKHTFDEVTVNIGRNGQLIHNSSGRHRLCIARILDIESIPVRVLIRHKKWEQVRRNIQNLNLGSNSTLCTKKHMGHPDIRQQS